MPKYAKYGQICIKREYVWGNHRNNKSTEDKAKKMITSRSNTIMLTYWFSGTGEDELVEDQDFEEEEMLKRAIAMSLEEH